MQNNPAYPHVAVLRPIAPAPAYVNDGRLRLGLRQTTDHGSEMKRCVHTVDRGRGRKALGSPSTIAGTNL